MRKSSNNQRLLPRNYRLMALLLIALIVSGCSASLNPSSLRVTSVALPGGTGGIGFDDMGFAASLGRVIVPAGATGNLDLIDPGSLAIKAIAGFSSQAADPAGGHSEGTTSATIAKGMLFAIDRTTLKLNVVDPTAGQIIKSTELITTPDYIRYVPITNELWVTEKGASQIEIFGLSNEPVPQPSHTDVITFTNGPEALVIDSTRGMAYTNFAKKGETIPIDLKTRQQGDPWANGCTATRGMTLDEQRGILFVACKEGKIAALDAKNGGKLLANATFGSNLDFLGFNPHLSHLYIPSGQTAVLGIYGVNAVSATGQLSVSLTLLGSADTALGSKCITTDNADDIWVCNPNTGAVLQIKDTLPTSVH